MRTREAGPADIPAMLAAADDAIGSVMAQVKKQGQLENTLVVFSADNGATREARAGLNQKPATAGGNGVFRGYKFSLFDGGMHVPAAISWPGHIPAGKVNREVGMHADLLPTICGAVGASVPNDRTIDGRDVMPMITGGAQSPHEAIFWSSGGQLAVRRGKWKLVKNGALHDGTESGNQKLKGDDALFLSDLEADPGETRNLRHDNPTVTDELATLAASLDRSLTAAGWAAEGKPFRAHLTLARADGVPAGARVAGRLIEAAAGLRLRCPIDRIGLFESLTGGGPARYEPIELVRLGAV